MTVAQQKIKDYCKKMNISQMQLAEKLGYHHNCIQWIYRGHIPNINNIKNYEEYFNITNNYGSEKTKALILDKYRYYRNIKRWYQLQTGDDIHIQTITAWVNGEKMPSFKRLKRFCQCFNIENEWIKECSFKENKKTAAQKKIRSIIGYDVKNNIPDLGVSKDVYYSILKGGVPNYQTQKKINKYFNINNDFIDNKPLNNLEQKYIDFILDTKARIGYVTFNRIMRGQTCKSKYMKDICKYFNIQNDYFGV